MNKAILSQEVQDFLRENAQAIPTRIALKKSPFPQVSSTELVSQIASKQKTRKKLPLWHNTRGIYFPASISVEQSSSERTASYKLRLIEKNIDLIDLTGGFGVDAYYFSTKANNVVHCEANTELSAIAEYNAHLLGVKNTVFITGDGMEYLETQKEHQFDVAYIDPSRRGKKGKVFMLGDCEPNVIELQEAILQKVGILIIKAAPLLDISAALLAFRNVKEIHILSVKNECKEILFILEKGIGGSPEIHTVDVGDGNNVEFSFLLADEKNAAAEYGMVEKYLFEPNTAIMKAGCFKLIAERLNLRKIHMHTHLYTSDEERQSFPGRRFKVLAFQEYGDFKKKKKKWKANVISRNFPLKTEEIKKRHGIADGSETYLFFCRAVDEKLTVIITERLF